LAVEKLVQSKLLVPGANRRIQNVDRHIGIVRTGGGGERWNRILIVFMEIRKRAFRAYCFLDPFSFPLDI